MPETVAQWLAAQWKLRFGEILLTMGDLQPQIRIECSDESVVDPGLLWWEQHFSCTPDGTIWTGAREETWSQIGTLVLAAAGVHRVPGSEARNTYLEIVRQSMSSLASDIGQRIKASVHCADDGETDPRKIARHVFSVTAEFPGKTITIVLVIADDLCNFVTAAENAPTVRPAALPAGTDRPVAGADASLGTVATSTPTLEVLLDVELPVSVSFGRTTLKLQDAARLMTGSLIELDRALNDPVELLVNNCVIARGEVVVVEGNYGVRITEIVSQKERLQQTRRYVLQ